MSKLVSILRDTYIRFLIWLGAEAPPGYEHYLPGDERSGEYTLQAGETIFSVARKFGVHYERIAQANNIQNLDSVNAGQTLIIPPPGWQPPTETPALDETVEPAPDEAAAGPEDDDLFGVAPAELTPLVEEIPVRAPRDWLVEAELTGVPVSSTEEPTLLPDDTELPTELPDDTTLPAEPEWLMAAESMPETTAPDTLSMAQNATFAEDVEWLMAGGPITTASPQKPPAGSPVVQEEIPYETPAASTPVEPAVEPPAEPEPAFPIELSPDEEMAFRYEVQRGDTLSSIAKRYSVTVMELLEANEIADPSRIFPGQKLVIPGYSMAKPEPEPEPGPQPQPSPDNFFIYTVAEGDTISTIAKRYGVTLRELVEVNNMAEPNQLWIGQRLYIPGILQQNKTQAEVLEEPVVSHQRPKVAVEAVSQPGLSTDPTFPPTGPLNAIRALYLSYFAVGHADSLKRMFQLLNQTEFNAVVIDVKGEHGWISYPSMIPRAHGIDQAHPTSKDFAAVLQELRGRDIYTIGRIATFKDHPLATSRSDLSLKTPAGNIWQDRDNAGWSDPFLKPVWDYNIQIAVEAAQKGFDEIQFDYLRFPSDSQAGTPQYSQEVSKETRVAAVIGFLSAAKGQLQPFGVKIAADAFGYTCWRKDDTLIGQDIERMARYLDVLSPKLYPSAFGNGIPGYKLAIAYPYEVVFESAKRAVERVGPLGCVVRPWLQDFPDYRFDKRVYGREEIQAQIKGCFDAGASGFMVWNPEMNYTNNAYAPVRKG